MSRDRTDPTLDRALSDVPGHLDQSRSASVSQQTESPRDISEAGVRQPPGGLSRLWDDVDLPRSGTRQPVDLRDRTIHLRQSESRILVTVGTFE